MKSTVEEIRERFDADVERFSNLDTGQAAMIDAPLLLELVTSAAAATTPTVTDILDVGCGAGNFTVKLLQALGGRNVTLVDLSRPMLDRAFQRISPLTAGTVTVHQADIRDLPLGEGEFDIIIAAAVLHHLRTDDEWRSVFAKFHRALRPGGTLWISDLIEHTSPGIQQLMRERYGEYLAALKGQAYREEVFAYVEREDTPRPLMEQVDLMRSAGFVDIDILHKNSVFAAFGGRKG